MEFVLGCMDFEHETAQAYFQEGVWRYFRRTSSGPASPSLCSSWSDHPGKYPATRIFICSSFPEWNGTKTKRTSAQQFLTLTRPGTSRRETLEKSSSTGLVLDSLGRRKESLDQPSVARWSKKRTEPNRFCDVMSWSCVLTLEDLKCYAQLDSH